MNEILLIGAGGHTCACIDVIEISGEYQIVGLIEKDKKDIHRNLGYPIIGIDDDLKALKHKFNNALITVGQIKSPKTRVRLFDLLNQLDYTLPVIVSPKTYVSKHAQIGQGTIIMHGAIVNANATIGKNCIINNRALIEHGAVIGDHCHIATGSIINGEVSVGNKTFIGSGVITKQSISIGSNCIIGAGAVVKIDVASKQVIKN